MSQLEMKLPASPLDWANYIGGLQDSNALLSIAAVLECPLPRETVLQALAVLLKGYPILGGRFIEAGTPFWQIAAVDPSKIYREWSAQEQVIDRVLTEILNRGMNGCFQLSQVRLPDGKAVLVLTIHHALTDGAGLKEVWRQFAAAAGEAGPATEFCRPGESERMPDHLLKTITCLENWRELAAAGSARQKEARSLLQSVSSETNKAVAGPDGSCQVCLRHWPEAEMNEIMASCHRADVTLTEYLLADILTRWPGRAIQITVNLRRYLPATSATGPANLSGMELAGFPDLPDELAGRSMATVLPLVRRCMRSIKEGLPGISSLFLQMELPKLGYEKVKGMLLLAGQAARQSGKTAPLISNIGEIPGDAAIASCPIQNVFLVPAGFDVPAVMLSLSSWRGQLTAGLVCRGGQVPSAFHPADLFQLRV